MWRGIVKSLGKLFDHARLLLAYSDVKAEGMDLRSKLRHSKVQIEHLQQMLDLERQRSEMYKASADDGHLRFMQIEALRQSAVAKCMEYKRQLAQVSH